MPAAAPDQSTNARLHEAERSARQGDRARARRLLRGIIAAEPDNRRAWMLLAYVADSVDAQRAALRRALALQPDDKRIENALRTLETPAHIRAAAARGIFIAYARSDELFALDLTMALREAGVDVWLDMTDADSHPDADWHGAIIDALRRAGLMLVVASPAALEASDLHTELNWFQRRGKLALPVLHQPCSLDTLKLTQPPVDFRGDFAIGMQLLLRLLTST